jgi:hypothetical protein
MTDHPWSALALWPRRRSNMATKASHWLHCLNSKVVIVFLIQIRLGYLHSYMYHCWVSENLALGKLEFSIVDYRCRKKVLLLAWSLILTGDWLEKLRLESLPEITYNGGQVLCFCSICFLLLNFCFLSGERHTALALSYIEMFSGTLQSSEVQDEQPPRYSVLEATGWSREGPEVQGFSDITKVYLFQYILICF